MRKLTILIGYLFILHEGVPTRSIYSDSERSEFAGGDDDNERNNLNASNIIIADGKKITAKGYSDVTEENITVDEGVNWKTNNGLIDHENATEGLLMAQRRRCLRSKAFFDCLKFKIFKFLRGLFEPLTNNSVLTGTWEASDEADLTLVTLPGPNRRVLSDTMRSKGDSAKILEFVMEELDRFLSRHGLIITVKDLSSHQPIPMDPQRIIASENMGGERTPRRLKKKEMKILFPLLVLVKFAKIKMLLMSILIGVGFVKKLFILTLGLLPYAIGFFGSWRRNQLYASMAQPAVLQEVDTRGEYSSNLGYTVPFRHGEKVRPPDLYGDY